MGGVSTGRFESLNLGESNDDPAHVASNRECLRQQLGLKQPLRWVRQVHGIAVVDPHTLEDDSTEADALVTRTPGVVCGIRTADCLPVLLCCNRGRVVGAAHAGWRGLCAGVLEATVRAMDAPPGSLLAWLGPAISARNYEVGDEVREQFIQAQDGAGVAFTATRPGHWLADLAALARMRLHAMGLPQVYACGRCTFEQSRSFYSYRRDGVTGRMASLIWIRSGD